MSDGTVRLRVVAGLAVVGSLALGGCTIGGGGTTLGTGTAGGTPLAAGGASIVYAVQGQAGNSAAIAYAVASGTGGGAPISSITAPLNTTFTAVAMDSFGDIYVGAVLVGGVGEILVYSPGSSGAATPMWTIPGGNVTATTTFAGGPRSLHVSLAGTLSILSVGSAGYSVETIANAAFSPGTATTLIRGAATQMNSVSGATVDKNGVIYVSNLSTTGAGQVLEFAPGATGNVAPTTVLSVGAFSPTGIAADGSGNVFVALTPQSNGTSEIAEFAPGASGAATPVRTIAGLSTGIISPGGLRQDSPGNLYVLNETGVAGPTVAGFAPSASGNVAPGMVFTAGTLTAPTGELAIH